MEDKPEELVETISRILPPHPSQVDEANEEAVVGEEELIEECESHTEDKAEELVETITRILPPHPSQVDEANEKAAEGEEEETVPE
ncbi:hypothetical protein SASPL_152422 [Salvia splendens]|uniref:Uncharacterized protein n=1 Tax=Salvia splendens TaxID=180675 RepID=A0A8X8W399_SALSN|nr:hypothetical protein SASPL_152422 [Salvia splendens]